MSFSCLHLIRFSFLLIVSGILVGAHGQTKEEALPQPEPGLYLFNFAFMRVPVNDHPLLPVGIYQPFLVELSHVDGEYLLEMRNTTHPQAEYGSFDGVSLNEDGALLIAFSAQAGLRFFTFHAGREPLGFSGHLTEASERAGWHVQGSLTLRPVARSTFAEEN
ncbi:MAG: hypothetical protein ACFB21_13220 [Opitutales bacterium]